MLPSTAPFGADPDSYHHSWVQLLIQWHLYHRGPYRPNSDLHLWVFKGRGSSTCSAQICINQMHLHRDAQIHHLPYAGLGGSGPGLQSEQDKGWTLSSYFTYNAPPFPQVTVDGTDEDKDGSSVSSFKTVTSETSGTTITTTTTHISKVSAATLLFAVFFFMSLHKKNLLLYKKKNLL